MMQLALIFALSLAAAWLLWRYRDSEQHRPWGALWGAVLRLSALLCVVFAIGLMFRMFTIEDWATAQIVTPPWAYVPMGIAAVKSWTWLHVSEWLTYWRAP